MGLFKILGEAGGIAGAVANEIQYFI